jgi:2-oxoglutarate/2-oxoacid ferredoxin oxidoreductase subunit alpha
LYNLLAGGAAGQGVETTVAILERFLKQAGCGVFTTRDLMSRIRGGHNFSRIRFGEAAAKSHTEELDGIIAMNAETIAIHKENLRPAGFILCDAGIPSDDPRAIRLGMTDIAKTLGNARAAGSVAIGAALRLFGLPLDAGRAEEVFKASLKAELLDVNVQAALAGYAAVQQKFAPSTGVFAGHMLVSGNKALALGAMAAGLQFYAAYPMSPSTSILEYISQKAEALGIVAEQAEDEIAAINMAIGASFAGGRAMTGTSGGGFSLMVEALGLSGMAEIPLVVVDVQRPGPTTGLPTRTEQSDLKFVISAAQGEFPRMVIALRHHEDAYFQTIRAFSLAEKYQIPVILLSDQYLADATATIPVPDPYAAGQTEPAGLQPEGGYARYRYTDSGISPRLFPGTSGVLRQRTLTSMTSTAALSRIPGPACG